MDVYLLPKREDGAANTTEPPVGSLRANHFRAKYPADYFTPSGTEMARARGAQTVLSRFVDGVATRTESMFASPGTDGPLPTLGSYLFRRHDRPN